MKKARIDFLMFIKIILAVILFTNTFAQARNEAVQKYPVIIKSDTLFYINAGKGVLSAEKRTEKINSKLNSLVKSNHVIYDSILVTKEGDF